MELRSRYAEPDAEPAAVDWPALELHDVFKIYGSGQVETVALRGLELRVERGELVAVLGASGSGKSTMLALAAGFDRPSAGEVRAFGRSLLQCSADELAAYRARQLAVIFQHDNLWRDLSAHENVIASLRLAGRRDPGREGATALRAFGVAERGGQRPAQLSGGEQQRVALAAAAARRAPLVLADEPTGELDRHNERLVLSALEALRDHYGSAVVVVTHSEPVAAAADRVIELRDGRVAA